MLPTTQSFVDTGLVVMALLLIDGLTTWNQRLLFKRSKRTSKNNTTEKKTISSTSSDIHMQNKIADIQATEQ
jgi:adenosyl cobinamide kinase/adenosyl cobinamide phosphate guanylyltransferase